jgi:hypothetical protein
MINRARRLTPSSTLLATAECSVVADEDRQGATVFRPFDWPYDQFDTPSPYTAITDVETQLANASFAPSATLLHRGARVPLWFALATCVSLAVLFPVAIISLSLPLSQQADNTPVAPPEAMAHADTPPAPVVGDAASLVAQGDRFLGSGDVVSARLYYEQAAKQGDGRAAMFVGLTFDSGFLDRTGAHELQGNNAEAAAWYRRAHDLGQPGAVRLLASLGSN